MSAVRSRSGEKKGLTAVVGQHTLSGVGDSPHAAWAIRFRIGRTINLYLDVYNANTRERWKLMVSRKTFGQDL